MYTWVKICCCWQNNEEMHTPPMVGRLGKLLVLKNSLVFLQSSSKWWGFSIYKSKVMGQTQTTTNVRSDMKTELSTLRALFSSSIFICCSINWCSCFLIWFSASDSLLLLSSNKLPWNSDKTIISCRLTAFYIYLKEEILK